MDLNSFNLFLKMISEEYCISSSELEILKRRLLADPDEFDKVWRLYRLKGAHFHKGVDPFKFTLEELLRT